MTEGLSLTQSMGVKGIKGCWAEVGGGINSRDERSASHASEILRAWLDIQESQENKARWRQSRLVKGGDLGTRASFMLLSTS